MSHWGQDFRKSYLNLKTLRQQYPKVPLLGLTATASVRVKEDISKKLGISESVIYFQSSYNRPNLFYQIREKKTMSSFDEDLSKLITTKFKDKTGIIYCVSQKECEKLAEKLKRNHKVKCDYYHADLSPQRRSAV